jgi:2-keto-4-pentenoate hydratase/2-oxohepta-3-ene-1,7-dioic acid hydratase in catechol pathway
MNGTEFKLATYAGNPGRPFAAIVLGDTAIDIAVAYPLYRASPRGKAGPLTATESLLGLMEGWDRNFPVLQEMVAFIEQEGLGSERFRGGTAKIASLRPLPPLIRPGKIFNAAQNFQEHVNEMLRAGMTPAGGPQFTGDKSTSRPYLFLKAPSVLAGAYDDIAIPRGMAKIDWEAEIACAIWKPA